MGSSEGESPPVSYHTALSARAYGESTKEEEKTPPGYRFARMKLWALHPFEWGQCGNSILSGLAVAQRRIARPVSTAICGENHAFTAQIAPQSHPLGNYTREEV